ncbi:MAG: hypothetical protein PUF66_03885 [Clostridium sp.]|nr:hypothetical protein [Clostridium sp.]
MASYSDLTQWEPSEVRAAIKLLEESNIQMSRQLSNLRTETHENFEQNYKTSGGQVAINKIDTFVDQDGKRFNDYINQRIADLQYVLGQLENLNER